MKALIEDAAAIRATLGRRSAELRRLLDLTQEAFAARAGWDVKYVQRIEQGRANLTLNSLIHLAAMLEVALIALFEPSEHKGSSRVGRPPSRASRGP